jgi:hypothetical protein
MTGNDRREETLSRLARLLDEYLQAVPRQKDPDAPDLLALFTRLDALEAELDNSYPGQLRHYLHQKSYRKAHLFLQGGEAAVEKGACS